MRFQLVALSLLTCCLLAPGFTNAATHGTRAFYGPCVYGNDRAPPAGPSIMGEGFAASLGAIASGIIDASLGRFGRALRAAGEEDTTMHAAQKNIELGAGYVEPCLQLVRGTFTSEQAANVVDDALDKKINRSSKAPSQLANKSAELNKAGIFLSGRPDFFAELQIRLSTDYSALSVAPTFVSYNRLLKDRSFKSKASRGLALQIRIHQPGVAAEEEGSTGGAVVLGDLRLGTEIEFLIPDSIADAYPVESAWFPHVSPVASGAAAFDCAAAAVAPGAATPGPTPTTSNGGRGGPGSSNPVTGVPQNATRKGAADKPCRPFTITVSIAETRSARPFVLFLADVFDSSKDTIKSDLENNLIKSKRDAAELAEYTATQNALVAYGQNKVTVESRMIEYCTADYTNLSSDAAKLLALAKSQAVSAAQAAANISARTAGLAPPYPALIVPSEAIPQAGVTLGCGI